MSNITNVNPVSRKPINFLPNVGPFNFVWADKFREVDGIKFRVVGYCAYNAMGLIGSEFNGIAILSETHKSVVTDNIGCDSSYMEVSNAKLALFMKAMTCSVSEFKAMCLEGRSRYA